MLTLLRVGLTALLVLIASPALAAEVVQIEEEWSLQVGGPEPGISAPQVTMVMSPTGGTAGKYFLVSINHWTEPEFEPGGVQVQRWDGDACIETSHSPTFWPLETDGEVITWTQRMTLENGVLKFEVVDGSCPSWGSFGSMGDLRVQTSTRLTQLNDYKPAVSLNESGIGFAGNRVSSLVLKRLTWTTSDGVRHEKVAPIDIDTDLDP